MLVRVAAVTAALAVLATPVVAEAHARLMSARPAVDSVGPAPTAIRIAFDEAVVPKFSGIVLTDAAGKAVPVGKTALDPKDKKAIMVPVKKTLPAGAYLVTWHAVSDDTHRVGGTFKFTVR
jgi:methionine-rich copper-binding protein CopC